MKASQVPELKQGQMITILYLTGFFIALFIVYKLLLRLGIIKGAKRKRAEREEAAATEMLRTDEYWNPEYWRKMKPYKQLGGNIPADYAQAIHDSIYGRLNTDYEKIFTTFGKLYNKVNVSEVAALFQVMFEKNLQSSLLNNLNDKHIAELMNIVNGLPNK